MRVRVKLLSACLGTIIVSSAMCAAQTGSISLVPIADAFVTTGANGSLSSSNFGAAGSLAIAASGLPEGEFQSVLKFDLSSAASSFNTQFGLGQWTIQSVTLDLTASPHNNQIFNAVAAGSFGVSLMASNSWTEGTGTGGVPSANGISFSSLQSMFINSSVDQALGTFSFGGNTSGQNSYGLTLSSGLTSDVMDGDIMSLRLFAPSNSTISYLMTSRQGAVGFQPELMLDVVAVPEPGALTLCVLALVVLSIMQFFRYRKKRTR